MDLKPLVTLLAIVNPLAIVPFFIHYTNGFGREQRVRTVWVASFGACVVIATSALLGLQILEFFSISPASFQVGGGLLLMTSALSMLNPQPAEARSNADELDAARRRSADGASVAVVALTIPLLAGPAAMSTVVIYAERAIPGPHRHQRHDAPDGADPGGAGGRGDVGRAHQAVPGPGRPLTRHFSRACSPAPGAAAP